MSMSVYSCLLFVTNKRTYYQVIDVSRSVHQLYSRLDPVSLEVLVTEVNYFSSIHSNK